MLYPEHLQKSDSEPPASLLGGLTASESHPGTEASNEAGRASESHSDPDDEVYDFFAPPQKIQSVLHEIATSTLAEETHADTEPSRLFLSVAEGHDDPENSIEGLRRSERSAHDHSMIGAKSNASSEDITTEFVCVDDEDDPFDVWCISESTEQASSEMNQERLKVLMGYPREERDAYVSNVESPARRRIARQLKKLGIGEPTRHERGELGILINETLERSWYQGEERNVDTTSAYVITAKSMVAE